MHTEGAAHAGDPDESRDEVGQLMDELVTKSELSGPVYEDIIHLKSIYSRYQNYAHWLKQNAR